ncbi:MAG: hypothetical protein CM15mP3_05110 [Candidatus Poseidoniales archaeon]|nr:MAG: hypothetical protein CM15mP3_05110 [Candidatus Poseidoniales archaeon]
MEMFIWPNLLSYLKSAKDPKSVYIKDEAGLEKYIINNSQKFKKNEQKK